MSAKFSNKKSVVLHASFHDVWIALTDANLIKQYFFGVEVSGEWKEGNTILYKGEWQGKKFEGKAKVLQAEDQKLLKYSYWSNMSGQLDLPENYHIITYRLEKNDDHTLLTMSEENLDNGNTKEQSSKIWDMVFQKMKELLDR